MATRLPVEVIISAIDNASKTFEGIGKNVKGVSDKFNGLADNMIKIGAAPTAALAFSTKAAIDFESAFAGVRKTVDASEAEFQALSKNIRQISKETPASAVELSKIGELAGQLGVRGVDNLTKFIDTIAKVGVTTNLTGEEAATSFARIANIMQEPIENVDRMASTVVDLGNNFATTEAEIVNFANRIAGAGKIAGLATADIFAIGTAMSSVGVEAEAGGTAVQKVLLSMNEALVTNNSDLKIFADTAKMSIDTFKDLSAAERFNNFVMGLGEQGDRAISTLSELGLEDQRLIRSFLSLANAGTLVIDANEKALTGWKNNIALTTEAEKRFATTASQMKIMRNNINDIAITLGSVLLPKINATIDKLKPMIDGFAKFSEENPKVVTGVLGVGAAIGTAGVAIRGIVFVLGPLVSLFSSLATWLLPMISAAIPAVTTFFAGLGAAIAGISAPVWIVIGAIAALVAGGIYLWKNWDQVSANVSKGVEKMKAAFEVLKTVFFGFLDLLIGGDFKGEFGRALGIDEDSEIVQKILAFREAVIQVWNSVIEFFYSIPERLVEFKDTLVEFFTVSIPEAFQALGQAIQDMFVTAGENMLFGIGFLAGIIWYGFPMLVQAMIEAFTQFYTWMSESIPLWWEQFKLWLANLIPATIDLLTQLYNSFVQWGVNTWTYLSTNIPIWWQQFNDWLAQLIIKAIVHLANLLIQFIQFGARLWGWMSAEIPRQFNAFIGWVSELPSRAYAGLSSLVTQVMSVITQTWNAVVSEVSSWPSRMFDWGRRMAQSFIDGFGHIVGAIVGKIKEGFESARGYLEGHSPPKKGPFKNIDKWGFNVGSAYVESFGNALSGLTNELEPTRRFGAVAPVLTSAPTTAPQQSQVVNNITIQIPMFAGSELEKRTIAEDIWEEVGRVARSVGKTPQELIGFS